MNTIWKAVLNPTDIQTVKVPHGAEFIHAREQHGKPCVWFRCQPGNGEQERTIVMVGTGHAELTDLDRYIGTASLMDGNLMLHVFERERRLQ